MFQKLRKAIAEDNPLNSEALRILSLVFLLVAAAMSLLTYTKTGEGWLWSKTVEFTFSPSVGSSIAGLLLAAPLYMRGILRWNKSIYSIVSFVLILMVFASFIELILGGNGWKQDVIKGLLVTAFLLSWLGIRAVAGVAWILVLIAAIYSARIADVSMGTAGFVYICSGTLGLMLHSGLNLGEFVQALKHEYSGMARSALGHASRDLNILVDNSPGRLELHGDSDAMPDLRPHLAAPAYQDAPAAR